jgi:hypothetical protein
LSADDDGQDALHKYLETGKIKNKSAQNIERTSLKLVEARGSKKKTSHQGEEAKIFELQAILPQKMPLICIPHKNILFSSIIIGKQVMKNLYLQERIEVI